MKATKKERPPAALIIHLLNNSPLMGVDGDGHDGHGDGACGGEALQMSW